MSDCKDLQLNIRWKKNTPILKSYHILYTNIPFFKKKKKESTTTKWNFHPVGMN